MGKTSKIEWTDSTFSPWRGCTKVSEGCANCYAEGLAKRFGKGWGGWGRGETRVSAKDDKEPRRWNMESAEKRKKALEILESDHAPDSEVSVAMEYRMPLVFPSLCDPFDTEVDVERFSRFMMLIKETDALRWMLLTKRPENVMGRLHEAKGWLKVRAERGEHEFVATYEWILGWLECHAPSNVWLGVSVENQKRAQRVQILAQLPAAGRFISAEPLLDEVVLGLENLPGKVNPIDWVKIGGESGPSARPCSLVWIEKLVRECERAGVAPFVKQLGAWPITPIEGGGTPGATNRTYKVTDPKGGNILEFPEALRVRRMPLAIRGW